MSGPLTILVTGRYDAAEQALLRRSAPGARVEFVPGLAAVPELVEVADAIAGNVPDDLLGAARRLRWVHSPAAGVDTALTPGMLASDVVLTSATGNGAIPLAEHALLLMMMLNRDVPRWLRAQADRRWDRFTHDELAGRTVGLFGLGGSGLDLARKAKACHMRVLGMRRRPGPPDPAVDEILGPGEFHRFLGACDFVVVTAPLTADTRGVFDRAAFEAMRPTAFFVCVSRGGIADDEALLDALRDRRIAGAGLDAHGVEPLPQESPFWGLPNVIITPHNGATTEETARRGLAILADNLGRFCKGEPLRNIVDKAAGY
ncbi:D-2-hydroxyacid dehydrogenase [Nonomuraea maritima]|uniref:D-2-hydroxyacid dehydrogenase n=1 Tax=Nonomuraea maritima TaxID=683260 RepID=UPI0037202A89